MSLQLKYHTNDTSRKNIYMKGMEEVFLRVVRSFIPANCCSTRQQQNEKTCENWWKKMTSKESVYLFFSTELNWKSTSSSSPHHWSLCVGQWVRECEHRCPKLKNLMKCFYSRQLLSRKLVQKERFWEKKVSCQSAATRESLSTSRGRRGSQQTLRPKFPF